jgi:hypothetical protein
MKTKLDADTLNWMMRLFGFGLIVIGIYLIFEYIPYTIRILGNVIIMGGLLFLMDIEGGKKFKMYYRFMISIWIIIVIHSFFFFILNTTEEVALFRNYNFLSGAISLLSTFLFFRSMHEYCLFNNLNEQKLSWSNAGNITIGFYILPFIGFVIVGIARLMGKNVELFYGLNKSIPIPVTISELLFRLLFFVLPALLLLKLNRLKKSLLNVVP